ncbi:hypothetical protein MHH54_08585 [Bacillus sp. FSL K6-4563]|nr:hypothetical protein [Bacillus pumilus]MCR4354017.1 hypothetical protein [Bacillus pumilus]MCY7506084.1 hypothetical protein [Bacillus pumilus]MED4630273.1 hypothetical protein [Bacillus pumilus]MED4673321.1 hypothetical protein [Bacillus pumilus]MED4724039.1 hypothetical protein [Bacillus pumilus]
MSLWNTIKNMIFKQEAKSTVNTLEEIADPPLKIDEYPKYVSETSYSVKYEEEDAFFEYITFNVAGVSYYQKEIKKAIAQEKDNYNFEEKYNGMTNTEILEYTYDEPIFLHQDEFFSDCYLQLEEDNEHDPQAIAVYVNDLKVGHVPLKDYKKGKEFIFRYLKDGISHPVSSRLYGGKYKINRDDIKVDTGESTYKIECQIVIKTNKQ